MIFDVLMVLLSLGFILISCLLFINAVEAIGAKLNLGQGVVGSILAAIGTALPETIIPIIAIVFSNNKSANEIGIGAIAGAPFMLSTLAFFVTGLAVIIFSALKKRKVTMSVNAKVFSHDLQYFILIYGVAIATTFVHKITILKAVVAIILMASYLLYMKSTISNEDEKVLHAEKLYLARLFRTNEELFHMVFQLILSLGLIILGAHAFVKYVENISVSLKVPALILSIIITPIATELPEKINSVIWIGRKQDTLALGNITGAMVFQSCFPVVFGMLFTSWNLTGITMLSAILALLSAIINYIYVKVKKAASPYFLMTGGILYAIFIVRLFF